MSTDCPQIWHNKTREVALRGYGKASILKYVNGGYILFVSKLAPRRKNCFFVMEVGCLRIFYPFLKNNKHDDVCRL